MRALLNAPHPVVIIGTLWPDRYAAYTAVPAPGGADPHAREREVLDLAAVIRIGPEFSPAEQDRARAAAARDPRLQVALDAAGYGLTQTLAAAPQLVARWEDAQTADPYAWAVLTAALDVARLGARAPLSADFLRAAAPGYCTSQQQAEAPDNWFEQALAYATGKLHGAAAALSPAGAGMGQIAGYTVADYLIQHASRERRYARVPASTWDAVLSHIRDPADAARLADSARNRLLYRYAIPLYRHAADAGDGYAAGGWPSCWPSAATWTRLRARADAGDGTPPGGWPSCWPSAATWTGCAPGPTPATTMPPGGWPSCWPSAATWTGCAPGPTPATGMPPGGWPSCWPSAATWTELRARADAGDEDAAWQLAELLAERGDLDGAEQILRARADAGDGHAAWRLAELLAERGDLDEAVQSARRADAGDRHAAEQLAELLAERGDLDELRARADAGDGDAAMRLAELLAERGDLDEAAQPGPTPATGCRRAAGRAAGRARRPGRGCAARADAGDRHAAGRLAELLAERGDLDGLRARADAGDGTPPSGWPSCWPSAATWTGCAPGPTPATGTPPGGWPSCWPSAATWTGCAPGPTPATGRRQRLAELLAERGDLDGLRARADAGDGHAAERLAELLAERGDLDGLRARADAGDRDAAGRLADLLIKQGRGEEAERLRRFGLNPDGSIACACMTTLPRSSRCL